MAIIGVTGTSCVGKTEYIKAFIKKWPEYKLVGEDLLTDTTPIKKTKKSFEKTEKMELDIMVEQLKGYQRGKDKIIMDGCILDNLIRVLWNKDKNDKISDDFVWQIVMKVKNHVSQYDAIFYIPLSEKYPIEVNDNKVDLKQRLEMAHLYEGIMETYKNHKGSYFPLENCPAIIEIFGSPKERLAITSLYMEDIDKIT